MRIKTMIIVLIAIILTVVLMQNTGQIDFQFLWITMHLSKLALFAFIAFIGFILGVLVGRPRKVKRFSGGDTAEGGDGSGTLSDEDRNYLH